MKQFYIYIHCRPATAQHPHGEPFYIGKGHSTKGCRGRAHQFYEETNLYYARVVSKHHKDNILIYVWYCKSEKKSLLFEKWMIAWGRAQGYRLTNLTDGGEGVSGYKHTPETRVALAKKAHEQWTLEARAVASERSLGIKQTPELIAARSKSMLGNQNGLGYKHTPERCAEQSERMCGKQIVKGYIRITDGINNKMLKPNMPLPQGWRKGRTGKNVSGYIWITDGFSNRRVKRKVPKGWSRGMTL